MTLPTTREVLEEHLLAKIKCLFPSLAEKVTKILCEDKSNSEIIQLLTSDSWLERNLDDIILKLDAKDRESYGNLLFQAVVSIEQELSAQVTGMLLELPPSTVVKLLCNRADLQAAVSKSRKEYLHYLKTGETSADKADPPADTSALFEKKQSLEEIGEIIYEKLLPLYPTKASKLTGMLLQMDPSSLNQILKDEALFEKNVKLSLNALKRSHPLEGIDPYLFLES